MAEALEFTYDRGPVEGPRAKRIMWAPAACAGEGGPALRHPRIVVLSAIASLLLLGAFSTRPAYGAGFTVNAATDTDDLTCNVANCTLREAINAANGNGNPAVSDVISFDIGAGTPAIFLGSGLPAITQRVSINGNTGGATRVQIDGFFVAAVADGLRITAGGGNVVQSMVITGFDGDGIELAGGTTTVQDSYIGAGADGQGCGLCGNAQMGVRILSSGNTIGGSIAGRGNVISGNGIDGINISGAAAGSNTIQGNRIGTNAGGGVDTGNGSDGIKISFASLNIIGGGTGTTPGGICTGSCNVISGNGFDGIGVEAPEASDNIISGNIIGLDSSGSIAIGNDVRGILLNGPTSTQIGLGTNAGRNVISGNLEGGIASLGATNTLIIGNYIGTNAAGTADRGNGQFGIGLTAAWGNIIGGTAAGEGNLVSGNDGEGVILGGFGLAPPGIQVLGNRIGTNAAGTAALPNSETGLRLFESPNVVVGDPAGTTPGGACTGGCNLISSNGLSGVSIEAGSTGVVVRSNYIGTNAAGTGDLGNTSHGIFISGAPTNTIGGTTSGARNVISGNGGDGLSIAGVFGAATGNIIQGNYVGTGATGAGDLGNDGDGVELSEAPDTFVGGILAGARNVISGNNINGIEIAGSGATGNTVQGNFIGIDGSGVAAVANESGVYINGASGNTIGGTTGEARNIIAGNGEYGVVLGNGATNNAVQGNYIGLDNSGSVAGNGLTGVQIQDAPGNTIGGTAAGSGNVISGNLVGIFVYKSGGDASLNVIQGNFIGTDPQGAVDRGNTSHGISITNAGGTIIGGASSGARNVISGNGGDGVLIGGSTAWDTAVSGNLIGTGAGGAAALGNSGHGVHLALGAIDSMIGGAGPGEGNVIAFNQGDGVALSVTAGIANGVVSNSIHSNGGLGIDLADDGVTENDAGDGDTGPNFLVNFPELTSAENGSTRVQGTFSTQPVSEIFVIQFFYSPDCDPSGYGEGRTFLGETQVTTNAGGFAGFDVTFPDTVPAGEFITATTLAPAFNTSEFSACVEVTGAATPTPSPTPTPTPVLTPTPTPTPTPTGTPSGPLFGDVDCDGDVDAVDALKILRYVAQLTVQQEPGCPLIGSDVASFFGDVDCNGGVTSVDALKILRFVASLPVQQEAGCTPIGD